MLQIINSSLKTGRVLVRELPGTPHGQAGHSFLPLMNSDQVIGILKGLGKTGLVA